MRRAFLAAVLLLIVVPAGVHAEIEEVEHYDSIEAITEASDAVVLGHVIDVRPGRRVGGCGYAAATVQVDALLAGTLAPPSRDQLILEYSDFCGEMPELGETIPRQPGVFFLRNKGVETRMFRPDATAAEIAIESAFWRTVILAGTVVNRNGAVDVPETMNAPFLAQLKGLPFDDFVREIATIGGLSAEPAEPAADPATATTGPLPLPEPILIAAAIASAILAVILIGRRLARSRDAP